MGYIIGAFPCSVLTIVAQCVGSSRLMQNADQFSGHTMAASTAANMEAGSYTVGPLSNRVFRAQGFRIQEGPQAVHENYEIFRVYTLL